LWHHRKFDCVTRSQRLASSATQRKLRYHIAVIDIVIIGAGASGLFAAARAAEMGAKVVVLEKNPVAGKKLCMTGGGRCNICNAEFDRRRLAERYGKQGKALLGAFTQFDAQSTFEFFEGRGLPLMVEAEKRAFPQSQQAQDVRDLLQAQCKTHGVDIRLGTAVRGVTRSADGSFTLQTSHGPLHARACIVATGGASHPETGSTGDAFPWLRQLGHTVTEPSTALVPIAVRERWVADVSGLAFPKAKVTVEQDGRTLDQRSGKMLFTHFGLSGPLILNMSKGIGDALEAGEVRVRVNLFPSHDPGTLDRLLLRDLEAQKNKQMKNVHFEHIPPRLLHTLLALCGIDAATPVYRLPKGQRQALVHALQSLQLTVSGLLGEDKAIVTSGGVLLKEVDFRTMSSTLVPGLYLIGDVLDFDRPSGGFSLQLCWTTGWIAAGAAASYVARP
jgi:predicted Rossmann fold flavoprotein